MTNPQPARDPTPATATTGNAEQTEQPDAIKFTVWHDRNGNCLHATADGKDHGGTYVPVSAIAAKDERIKELERMAAKAEEWAMALVEARCGDLDVKIERGEPLTVDESRQVLAVVAECKAKVQRYIAPLDELLELDGCCHEDSICDAIRKLKQQITAANAAREKVEGVIKEAAELRDAARIEALKADYDLNGLSLEDIRELMVKHRFTLELTIAENETLRTQLAAEREKLNSALFRERGIDFSREEGK